MNNDYADLNSVSLTAGEWMMMCPKCEVKMSYEPTKQMYVCTITGCDQTIETVMASCRHCGGSFDAKVTRFRRQGREKIIMRRDLWCSKECYRAHLREVKRR